MNEHTPIMGIGVLIVGVFLYGEFSRDIFSSKPQSPPLSPPGMDVKLNEIEHLQKLVGDSPTDTVNLLKLANMLQDQSVQDKRLLPRAVATYKKYLEINPASQNPRVDLGICYFELSKSDPENANEYLHMALREMEAVYKANPHHQFAAFNLGIVHLNAGSALEANDWFRRAVAVNPGSDLGRRAMKLLEEHTFADSPKQSSQNN